MLIHKWLHSITSFHWLIIFVALCLPVVAVRCDSMFFIFIECVCVCVYVSVCLCVFVFVFVGGFSDV
jgi:hypothetical protein